MASGTQACESTVASLGVAFQRRGAGGVLRDDLSPIGRTRLQDGGRRHRGGLLARFQCGEQCTVRSQRSLDRREDEFIAAIPGGQFAQDRFGLLRGPLPQREGRLQSHRGLRIPRQGSHQRKDLRVTGCQTLGLLQGLASDSRMWVG